MDWVVLVCSGLMESVWAIALDKSDGFSNALPTIVFIAAIVLSMLGLGYAAKTLPIGVAYAVWTGIGAVGTVIVGIVFFHEPATFWRLFFITTLICSIIGLKLLS